MRGWGSMRPSGILGSATRGEVAGPRKGVPVGCAGGLLGMSRELARWESSLEVGFGHHSREMANPRTQSERGH